MEAHVEDITIASGAIEAGFSIGPEMSNSD